MRNQVLRFLRNDLSVFPKVQGCSMHSRSLCRIFRGFAQRLPDSRSETLRLTSFLCLQGPLSIDVYGQNFRKCPLDSNIARRLYTINSQQVIDPKCRTLTIFSSELSLIQPGVLSSSDCAAKENKQLGL